MATITRFEDIEAWQDARLLSGRIYGLCRTSPLSREFGLKDQITKSAVSVMANIAEGFGRNRRTEFIQYLRIARGSCSEVQSHLYVALDAGLISPEDFGELYEQAEKAGRKISALSSYLTRNPKAPEPLREALVGYHVDFEADTEAPHGLDPREAEGEPTQRINE